MCDVPRVCHCLPSIVAGFRIRCLFHRFVEGEDLISRTVSHGKLTLIDLAGTCE